MSMGWLCPILGGLQDFPTALGTLYYVPGHLLSPAPWAVPNSTWAKLHMTCGVPVPGRVSGTGYILTTSCSFKQG